MNKTSGYLIAVIVPLGLCLLATTVEAKIMLKTICRLKGQEENTLQGLGIVVGLKGTGDSASSLPTLRSLASVMQYMGNPLGKTGIADLKDTKNVALVLVTAIVPAAGARQGDKVDCKVGSVGSAKSLAGGRLFTTYLMGPDPHNPRVYATAEGEIEIDGPMMPTTGQIHDGCQLEEEFFHPFIKEGKLTLVLNKSYADFQVASEIADLINSGQLSYQSSRQPLARAINQNNIEVTVPQQYLEQPVEFVAQVLGLTVPEPPIGARVVIKQRTGSIVISGDAEIGAALVTHKNMIVETGATGAASRFVPLDPGQNETPKLKGLVEALNAIHASPEDIVEILTQLEHDGKLHAQLIVE
ncbi:MAG: flagellar basal body P-ring protein FlgI [Thermoguttaceae bacterium]